MNPIQKLALVALATLALGACAAPPKVLIAQTFAGETKTGRILVQDTGAADPSTGRKLFNLWARVCNLQDGKQVDCQDSMIVENVVPGSVY